jgi:hypothetical protein
MFIIIVVVVAVIIIIIIIIIIITIIIISIIIVIAIIITIIIILTLIVLHFRYQVCFSFLGLSSPKVLQIYHDLHISEKLMLVAKFDQLMLFTSPEYNFGKLAAYNLFFSSL